MSQHIKTRLRRDASIATQHIELSEGLLRAGKALLDEYEYDDLGLNDASLYHDLTKKVFESLRNSAEILDALGFAEIPDALDELADQLRKFIPR